MSKPRKCRCCLQPFTPWGTIDKFCSNRCRQKHYRDRKVDREKSATAFFEGRFGVGSDSVTIPCRNESATPIAEQGAEEHGLLASSSSTKTPLVAGEIPNEEIKGCGDKVEWTRKKGVKHV